MITEFCTPAELRLCCLKAYGMELTEGDSAPKIKNRYAVRTWSDMQHMHITIGSVCF